MRVCRNIRERSSVIPRPLENEILSNVFMLLCRHFLIIENVIAESSKAQRYWLKPLLSALATNKKTFSETKTNHRKIHGFPLWCHLPRSSLKLSLLLPPRNPTVKVSSFAHWRYHYILKRWQVGKWYTEKLFNELKDGQWKEKAEISWEFLPPQDQVEVKSINSNP